MPEHKSKADDDTKPVAEDSSEQPDELIINDSTTSAAKEKLTSEPADDESKISPTSTDKKPASAPAPRKFSRKKIVLISSAIAVVLLGVLFAVPVTRYSILGVFIKKDLSLAIVDSKTSKPVSGMQVSVGDKSGATDSQGNVTIKGVPVGSKTITTKKKFYQDSSNTILVPLTDRKDPFRISVVATGRQVPVKIINKISTKPIDKAVITAAGASSTTNSKGEAVVVLPADKTTEQAVITAAGYNKVTLTVTITEQQDDKNTFTLVPDGIVYFLSKRTGKIDVMKSNLDGSNARVVLAGTGREEDGGTVLLASRDWKYLALQSRREGDKAKLYLIDTGNGDKLSTVDEGDATFSTVGWYNEYFAYTINRKNVKNWQPKQNALKSYNAKTGQLATLDETDGAGTDQNNYAQEVYGSTYILENLLVYSKHWFGDSTLVAGKHMTIAAQQPNGQQKRTLKDIDHAHGSIAAKLYKPQELYFKVNDYLDSTKTAFYEFEDDQLKNANIKEDEFNKFYPTFLVSPSGKSTFWYESRDGKNALFVGDDQGNNGQGLLTLSEFTPYGWYSDSYLLVSKKGSELYVISRSNPTAEPLKITDYHKPQLDFTGYGYGYGGF